MSDDKAGVFKSRNEALKKLASATLTDASDNKDKSLKNIVKMNSQTITIFVLQCLTVLLL